MSLYLALAAGLLGGAFADCLGQEGLDAVEHCKCQQLKCNNGTMATSGSPSSCACLNGYLTCIFAVNQKYGCPTSLNQQVCQDTRCLLDKTGVSTCKLTACDSRSYTQPCSSQNFDATSCLSQKDFDGIQQCKCTQLNNDGTMAFSSCAQRDTYLKCVFKFNRASQCPAEVYATVCNDFACQSQAAGQTCTLSACSNVPNGNTCQANPTPPSAAAATLPLLATIVASFLLTKLV